MIFNPLPLKKILTYRTAFNAGGAHFLRCVTSWTGHTTTEQIRIVLVESSWTRLTGLIGCRQDFISFRTVNWTKERYNFEWQNYDYLLCVRVFKTSFFSILIFSFFLKYWTQHWLRKVKMWVWENFTILYVMFNIYKDACISNYQFYKL